MVGIKKRGASWENVRKKWPFGFKEQDLDKVIEGFGYEGSFAVDDDMIALLKALNKAFSTDLRTFPSDRSGIESIADRYSVLTDPGSVKAGKQITIADRKTEEPRFHVSKDHVTYAAKANTFGIQEAIDLARLAALDVDMIKNGIELTGNTRQKYYIYRAIQDINEGRDKKSQIKVANFNIKKLDPTFIKDLKTEYDDFKAAKESEAEQAQQAEGPANGAAAEEASNKPKKEGTLSMGAKPETGPAPAPEDGPKAEEIAAKQATPEETVMAAGLSGTATGYFDETLAGHVDVTPQLVTAIPEDAIPSAVSEGKQYYLHYHGEKNVTAKATESVMDMINPDGKIIARFVLSDEGPELLVSSVDKEAFRTTKFDKASLDFFEGWAGAYEVSAGQAALAKAIEGHSYQKDLEARYANRAALKQSLDAQENALVHPVKRVGAADQNSFMMSMHDQAVAHGVKANDDTTRIIAAKAQQWVDKGLLVEKDGKVQPVYGPQQRASIGRNDPGYAADPKAAIEKVVKAKAAHVTDVAKALGVSADRAGDIAYALQEEGILSRARPGNKGRRLLVNLQQPTILGEFSVAAPDNATQINGLDSASAALNGSRAKPTGAVIERHF